MLDKKTKNEIADLKKQLKEHNEAYHTHDNPIISDFEYDEIKKKLQRYRENYPELFLEKNDILDSVGAKSLNIFSKITHKRPMLSLSNGFSEEDISKFIDRVKKFLGLNKKDEINNKNHNLHSSNEVKEIEQSNSNLRFFCEVKIDGLSFSARYENGKLKHVATRGDGKVGENVTENAKVIKDFPLTLKTNNPPKIFEVRGEIFMPKKDFIKLNKIQEEINSKIFANPRNAAAGSLRQLDKEVTRSRNLSYFAYSYGELSDDFICESQKEFIEKIENYGFKTEKNSRLCNNIDEIMDLYFNISNKRYKLDYDIDGMVYKVNSYVLQNRLGYVSTSPRFAISHKFAAEKSKTKIEDIIIQIGRTGSLTPVAILRPVNIGGVLVTRATLHNQDEIQRKDIKINDVVLVQRAGDVIPQILKSFEDERGENIKDFEFPKNCPSCGSKVVKNTDDVVLRCSGGLNCSAQLKELLKHFVSKDAFDIAGLGKKQIQNFFEERKVKSFADIFTLEKKEKSGQLKLKEEEGWGKKSVDNLFLAINNKRKISFERFIYAIGIRHVGINTAKIISNFFTNYENFKEIMIKLSKKDENDLVDDENFQDFVNLNTIGEKIARAVIDYFKVDKNIEMLENLEMQIEIEKTQKIESNSIYSGKTIVFTGGLENMTRPEAKKKAEDLGMKVVGSVSSKTNYVVAGKDSGSKLKKAKELNVNILDENSWLKIVQN